MNRKAAAFAVQDALASLQDADLSHFPGLFDAIPWKAMKLISKEASEMADADD